MTRASGPSDARARLIKMSRRGEVAVEAAAIIVAEVEAEWSVTSALSASPAYAASSKTCATSPIPKHRQPALLAMRPVVSGWVVSSFGRRRNRTGRGKPGVLGEGRPDGGERVQTFRPRPGQQHHALAPHRCVRTVSRHCRWFSISRHALAAARGAASCSCDYSPVAPCVETDSADTPGCLADGRGLR